VQENSEENLKQKVKRISYRLGEYSVLTQPASRAFNVVYQRTMTDFSAVKAIPFNGKVEHYEERLTAYVDYCTMKKCSNMILKDLPTLQADSDALDDTAAADLPFIKLREQNATAFSMLSLSTKGRSHVAVQGGKTTKNPSGYARKAWLNLKTLNNLINDLEKFNLRQKLNRS
jgi:hypothetical protein